MQEGSCNPKDFLEDGGSHSTAVISPFTNGDFLGLEDKFSFEMCDEKVTRRSQNNFPKGFGFGSVSRQSCSHNDRICF